MGRLASEVGGGRGGSRGGSRKSGGRGGYRGRGSGYGGPGGGSDPGNRGGVNAPSTGPLSSRQHNAVTLGFAALSVAPFGRLANFAGTAIATARGWRDSPSGR